MVSNSTILHPQSELVSFGAEGWEGDQGSVYMLTKLVVARKSGKGRKLILVPEEIAQRLMEVSNSEGKSFYGFVSETLEQALKAYAGGLSLEEMVNFNELMDLCRSLGAKAISDEAFGFLVSKVYETEKGALQKMGYEFGRLCGKSLKAKHDKPVEVSERFLPMLEWELNEVSVVEEKGEVRIRCISSILSIESTELLAGFTEEVMHELDYAVERQDCVHGMISLEFKKT